MTVVNSGSYVAGMSSSLFGSFFSNELADYTMMESYIRGKTMTRDFKVVPVLATSTESDELLV
jgi:hypothetical protein